MFSINQAFRQEPVYIIKRIKNDLTTLNAMLRRMGRGPVHNYDMLTYCTLYFMATLPREDRKLRHDMMRQLQQSFM